MMSDVLFHKHERENGGNFPVQQWQGYDDQECSLPGL